MSLGIGLGVKPTILPTLPQGGLIPETFFPVAGRLYFPNQFGGAGNTYVLSQTHHPLFDDVAGTVRLQWPNLRATTGLGTSGVGGAAEVKPGAAATATANVTYIDKATKSLVTVNLVDRLTGSTALTAPDGGLFDAIATINAAKVTASSRRSRPVSRTA